MLFTSHLHADIRSGDVTVAFRRWKRPTVKAGGTITTPAGVLAIDAVDEVTVDDIDEADLRRAGLRSFDELLASVHDESADRRLYRIRFHRAGDDPRIELRSAADLDDETTHHIDDRLDALDRASSTGPWTSAVLALIRDCPGEPARTLAGRLDVDQVVFKRRVRRLKHLGLTESLSVGYRISARGDAYLGRDRAIDPPGALP